MASWDEVVKDYEAKLDAAALREAAALRTVALAHKVVIITNVIAFIVGVVTGWAL